VDAFWNDRWSKDETGWKAFEKSRPFHDNIANVLSTVHNMPLDKVDVRSAIAGKSVFVPLSGDSAVLRFFYDMGAASVVGLELSEAANRLCIANTFADVPFLPQPHTIAEGVVCWSSEDKKVSILQCNMFELLANKALNVMFAHSFDFLYDRASLVAMHPSQRKEYAETILHVMKPAFIGNLELVLRNKETMDKGPPYHTPRDAVADLYGQKAVVTFVKSQALLPESKVPFSFELCAIRGCAA